MSDERPATKNDVPRNDGRRAGNVSAGNVSAGDMPAGNAPTGDARRTGKRRSDRDLRKMEPQIGRALRSVYDETVGEDIPPEMLELLGKLG